ncbi:hypothetical protein D3C81_1844010 [compost metagenome]
MDQNASSKVQVIEERVEQLTKNVDKHEAQIERLNEQVVALTQSATETKVYVTKIFTMLEDIKTSIRILNDRGASDRNENANRWLDVMKQFVFLVLGAAVAYFFTSLK